MKVAKFQYKCRQCGEVYTDGITSVKNAKEILINAVFDFKIKLDIELPPTMINVHSCKRYVGRNGEGVTDLIGYVIKEDIHDD